MKTSGGWRRPLVTVVVAVGAAAMAVVPLLVDGWWLDVSNPSSQASGTVRIALVFSCWISIIAGFIARRQRPDNPIGTWLIAAGLLSPAAFIVGGASPLIAPVSVAAFAAAAGLGAAVPISFPSGKLDGRAPLAVGSVVVVCVVYRVEQVIFFDPLASIPGWTVANPYHGLIDTSLLNSFSILYDLGGIAFLLVFGFWLARRWLRLTGPARRSIAPVLAGSLVFVGASLIQSVVETLGVTDGQLAAVRFVHTLTFGAIPIGFLAGLMRVRMARTAVADLVVSLGDTPEPAVLRHALSVALGDPSLDVLLWCGDEGGSYVGAEGVRVADLDAAAAGRAVTLLESGGVPLAAILHDPALLDDPGLVASVATAVRLTVENDRLEREVQAQLAEVRASRARIVEATDAERRRLERDIHDGAQQRLVALSIALGRARSQLEASGDPAVARLAESLTEASDEAKAALNEMRELARGIHPAILTQAGLEAAVGSLVERSTVPARLEGSVGQRLPAPVEAAAYFVASEGLANAAKHSGADEVYVALGLSRGVLTVEVGDDGCGGADMRAGRGLRGLRDRVEANGGSLEVVSPAGTGTTIRASLPVREEAP